jgi:septal ring factor EnvC (AmiA/AmiB activator)
MIRITAAAGAALAVTLAGSAWAQSLDGAIDRGVQRTAQAQSQQDKIDEVFEETQKRLREYQDTQKQIDNLEVYVAQLERQVANQNRELDSINGSLEKVTLIERQVTPLMLKMVDGLEQFVELDVPFLLDERRERVERISTLMDKANVSVAEKFRAVTGAYQTEMEYGRTIEAYRGVLPGEEGREVDFLRFGRVALVYQTLDQTEVGMWNPQTEEWEQLPREYVGQITQGIRIAREQAAPDLIRLPITTAEAAE